jgi:hypothetical protein
MAKTEAEYKPIRSRISWRDGPGDRRWAAPWQAPQLQPLGHLASLVTTGFADYDSENSCKVALVKSVISVTLVKIVKMTKLSKMTKVTGRKKGEIFVATATFAVPTLEFSSSMPRRGSGQMMPE